jgi:phytoene/squalene synthetase
MSILQAIPRNLTTDCEQPDRLLPASITRAASKQTYYTVLFLVDRDLVTDAYRAYGYFRWVDDRLDGSEWDRSERVAFVERQKAIMDGCYRGERMHRLADEESMLVALIQGDREKNSGLQAYIRNMMAVMDFDARRRGRLISQSELDRYTHWLAAGVTEALHYFIGHNSRSPQGEARYLAAAAAHITHMLRDTLEDVEAGYFNIPREFVELHGIDPREVWSEPYRQWVKSRVQLAKITFKAGRDYFAQVENLRCRLACYAYIARFDGTLDTIEREGYRLRAGYPERKKLGAALRMARSVLGVPFRYRCPGTLARVFPSTGEQP